jgi:hypothetical protein
MNSLYILTYITGQFSDYITARDCWKFEVFTAMTSEITLGCYAVKCDREVPSFGGIFCLYLEGKASVMRKKRNE